MSSPKHRPHPLGMRAPPFAAWLGALAMLVMATLPIAHAALPQAVDGQALPSLAPMLERVTPAVVKI